MAKRVALIVVIGLLLGSAVPMIAQNPTATGASLEATCRKAVEGMTALTADLGLPDHFRVENPTRQPDDFDVNRYFDVLDHLSVQQGYLLDYVYQYDSLGGYPILYTRAEDQAPFATVADYYRATGDAEPNYLDQIVMDGTPESIVQLAVLGVMGEQFMLYWHAGYNDHQILCDQNALSERLDAGDDFDQKLPFFVRLRASALSAAPEVTLEDETAQVRLLMFSNWSGFYTLTLTASREHPRTVFMWEKDVRVGYDCGVMF